MRLYIQIEDNQPINHPATESNLIDVFGAVPQGWEPFVRVPRPGPNEHKVVLIEQPEYRKIDGVWTDFWHVRDMTAEEIEATQLSEEERHALKVQAFKRAWTSRPYAHNFTAWVLNEELWKFEPPFPRPNDGKLYRWSGPDNNWKEAEPVPQDGKQYYFDFDNWANVEITDNV